MNLPDELLYRVGGILHNARMQECYGNWHPSWRAKWPSSLKEFRRQMMAGQPWIDVANAQTRALFEEGVMMI